MKYQFLLSVAITILSCNSRKSAENIKEDKPFDVSDFYTETLSIMQTLSIDIRDSIHLDSIPIIVLDTSLGDKDAMFAPISTMAVNEDKDTRIYISSKILVSKKIYDVLIQKKEWTPTLQIIDCESAIVHELCHFFQSTTGKVSIRDKLKMSRREYLSEPEEREGNSVGFYYLISKLDYDALRYIMSFNVDAKTKQEAIINTAVKMFYPDLAIPFPENPVKYR